MGGKLSQAKEAGLEGERKKPPHTTVNRFLSWVLPTPCARFVWRKPGEFPVTVFLLGAGTGGLLAVGLGALGWGTSSYIRCASLLLIPKMLGKEGRLLMLGYVLAAIYEGPVANLRHNLNEVVLSLGCTVELQINHTRMAWRVSTSPLRAVFKDLLSKKEELKLDTGNISNSFKELDAQVKSTDGYEPGASGELKGEGPELQTGPKGVKNFSTQKLYELKTKLRCRYIINAAVWSCHRWFDHKHTQCMQTIKVPIFNHLLCLPMMFKFLCNIAKVMEPWCRNRIPVEGNFGQTYDSLNQSMQGLGGEFSAQIKIKKEMQKALLGINVSKAQLREEVRDYVEYQVAQLDQALGLLRILLSCTFLLVFQAAFSYTDNYCRDIRFDNIYISTYFRQIDERRKKLGRRSLLPLRKAEKTAVIFPCKPTIQATEIKNVIQELLESLPVLMLLLILCVLDWAFYTIFDTIRKHSFLQYTFSSSHHLEVKVGGDSMLARLLRKTIGALNTSSDIRIESSNTACLPKPMGMNSKDYMKAFLPAGLLVLLCLTQAFSYRLRRVIAAFYFPKREKKRVLFFYNELLRKRLVFTKLRRTVIMQRAQRQGMPRHRLVDLCYRRFRLLRYFLRRRCVVCQASETSESWVCQSPGCGAVYCASCWIDMGKKCPACTPRDELSSSAYSNSSDDATYAE
ncbi:E3 ubiquitin-protein ligase DCST1 isoform X2 [Dromiciops gliroides]|uniref:E3 ubiquitin-protein ligase DCST1 isoform X2 n=1 Tax=Dromiciops gliroides TaxID=33562 RepID=UPI001CC3968D|nr:E3 ubiquitin-protein ligase DCST1 isoform X2 [Dromiciops gliroides]